MIIILIIIFTRYFFFTTRVVINFFFRISKTFTLGIPMVAANVRLDCWCVCTFRYISLFDYASKKCLNFTIDVTVKTFFVPPRHFNNTLIF